MKPLPDNIGVGFQTHEQRTFVSMAYREEQLPHFWRYYVTPKCWVWPDLSYLRYSGAKLTFDAFSPNLNKQLHVGHLRQLALANFLNRMFSSHNFVSLFGTTNILQSSIDEVQQWFEFLSYYPKYYYDALMPQDAHIVPRREGEGQQEGALVWDGPKGPVVVFRKPDETGHRRATYAFHDLAFAATVKPDFYVTGVEQVDHFKELGLGEKHLPMGLVVGDDGKKLKSRSGEAMTAAEAMDMVLKALKPANIVVDSSGVVKQEVPHPQKVAWNVIAWNLLANGTSRNVKFAPESWVKPEAPGMYCTYTWARLHSALDGMQQGDNLQMTQEDADLAGYSQYRYYYMGKAYESKEPAGLANYLYDLCRRATAAYHKERIRDGRPGFKFAISQAWHGIEHCMKMLGLFPVVLKVENESK